jgi:hypothetical protein
MSTIEHSTMADRIAEYGIHAIFTHVCTDSRSGDSVYQAHFVIFNQDPGLVSDGNGGFILRDYRMGRGCTEGPDLAEVLGHVASICADVDNSESDTDGIFDEAFATWCNDLDRDPDSRAAEKDYRAAIDIRDRFIDWLGDDRYRDVVWDTDR